MPKRTLAQDSWFHQLVPRTDDPMAWDVYNTIVDTNWDDAPGFGPIDTWPQSLRTLTALTLANTFPAALYWGEDFHMLYNACYVRDIALQKHPKLMGQAYRDGWSEVWEMSEELRNNMSGALRSGVAIHIDNTPYFVNRGATFQEEAYFSYTLAPVVIENGKIGGLFIEVLDSSRQVIGERRNKLLRQIGAITTASNTKKDFFRLLSEAFEAYVFDTPLIAIYIPENWTSEVAMTEDGESMISTVYSARIAVGVQPDIGAIKLPLGDQCSSDDTQLPWLALLRKAVETRSTIIVPTEICSQLSLRRAYGEVCSAVRVSPYFIGSESSLPLAIIVMGSNPRRPADEDTFAFMDAICHSLILGLAELKRRSEASAFAAMQQQRLEIELEKRTREVLRSEERFSKMATASPSGMFQIDVRTHRVTYVNDAWYRLTGNEFGTDPNNWFNSIHPDDVDQATQDWQFVNNGKDITNHIHKWMRNGEIAMLAVSTVHANDCIYGVLTDVTEEIKAREFEKLRADEAEKIKQQQESFFDSTSHELRNPLSAIVGSCDYLIEQANRQSSRLCNIAATLPSRQRAELLSVAKDLQQTEDLQTVISCSNHMKNIIGDVLMVSKLDGGHLQLNETICKPLDLVEAVLRMFRREMDVKQIAAHLTIEPSWHDVGIVYGYLDCARFSQIMINLINNAIKFSGDSPKKQIDVRVAATPSEEGSGNFPKIRVAISDRGCGMSVLEQTRLFAKFSQGSPRTAVKYGGSGLGLHICRKLAHLMGGEITCESKEGYGSTFYFSVICKPELDPPSGEIPVQLPLESMPEKPDLLVDFRHVQKQCNPKPETVAKSESIIVLLVEDNLINQKILTKQLSSTGRYTVLIANHGLEAIDIIRNANDNDTPIDVCLCDIEMPVCDGLECVRRVREMESTRTLQKRLPFLACSANARPEQIAAMIDAGMDATLSKPFRLQQVESKITELLAPSQ